MTPSCSKIYKDFSDYKTGPLVSTVTNNLKIFESTCGFGRDPIKILQLWLLIKFLKHFASFNAIHLRWVLSPLFTIKRYVV